MHDIISWVRTLPESHVPEKSRENIVGIIEEKELNHRLQGLRGARRRAQLAAISNNHGVHPSPLTLRDLRNGRRPRRSPGQELRGSVAIVVTEKTRVDA